MNLFKLKQTSLVFNSRSVHYLRSSLFIPSVSHQQQKDSKTKANKNENKSVSCLILENNGFFMDTGTGTLTYLPLGVLKIKTA